MYEATKSQLSATTNHEGWTQTAEYLMSLCGRIFEFARCVRARQDGREGSDGGFRLLASCRHNISLDPASQPYDVGRAHPQH